VLDLDNTLWGGIFNEDGASGLKLGPPDSLGEFYFEFQKALKALKDQGYLLALASKNNHDDIEKFWRKRVDLPLQWQDFAAVQIHWNRKSVSLQSIAQELNLGLDSLVFVDDDAVECAEVRHQLPMVEVIELAQFHLDRFRQLQPLSWQKPLTNEDQMRTQLYCAEKQRESFFGNSNLSEHDFYNHLQINVQFEELASENLSRAAQLFAKTNQFNLTLRRHTDTDLLSLQSQGQKIWIYSVSDRFGEYGAVGVVIFNRASGRICDWVMSCRVLNRMVERQVLSFLRDHYQLSEIEFEYTEGPRNHLTLEKLLENGARQVGANATMNTMNPTNSEVAV
jgi:FkbH-like protein